MGLRGGVSPPADRLTTIAGQARQDVAQAKGVEMSDGRHGPREPVAKIGQVLRHRPPDPPVAQQMFGVDRAVAIAIAGE